MSSALLRLVLVAGLAVPALPARAGEPPPAGAARFPGLPAAAVPPAPPPAWAPPDVRPAETRPGEEPLEMRLLTDPQALTREPPGAWCPPAQDVADWLRHEDLRARAAAPARPKAAGPAVRWHDGVLVIDDDGSLTRRDRQPDVSGTSVLFEPAGDGYAFGWRPLRWDDGPLGTRLFADQRGFRAEPVDFAAFAFPFGGSDRTRAWITSTFAIAFAPPPAPGGPQVRLGDALFDRTPRVAPFQQGTSLAGREAWIREDADRVVVTWRAAEGELDVDVQAVLLADGSILFSYASTQGLGHGAPLVVTGADSWWGDRALLLETLDPGGEVTDPPPPDGPAMDIVAVRAFQVGGSELVQVEVELEAPPPADTDGEITFACEIREVAGGPVLHTSFHAFADGRWTYATDPADWDGSTVRFTFLRSDLPFEGDGLHVTAWTGWNWGWRDAVGGGGALATPPVALMRDFTHEVSDGLAGPLIEAFTLPELLPYEVYRAVQESCADPALDGLAIFQTFRTDIVFYAGAYSTVGNAGADGIGAGTAAEPISPALLHMNQIRYGWNSWDEGKLTVLNHELGHHWLYFFSIDEGGTVGRPLNPDGGHPAGWAHTPALAPVLRPDDSSCMGGSTWSDNGDGTFTSAPAFVNHSYAAHELYLMGLADTAEVDDWWYLRDADPPLPGSYWPGADVTVTAERVPVTVDQVVTAMGPRLPAWPDTQRRFVVPMVLVTRPGEARQVDVDEVERTCLVWRDAFRTATLGRGEVVCDRVGWRPPEAVIVRPDADVVLPVGSTLTLVGEGRDPDHDAVTLTFDLDGLAPPVVGPGPHEVVLGAQGVFRVVLFAEDETGLVDDTPATLRVAVTCAVPRELLDLRVRREGPDGLRLTWADAAPRADLTRVLSSAVPSAAFLEDAVTADPGGTGAPVPLPPGRAFYLVAARNLPDCDGP